MSWGSRTPAMDSVRKPTRVTPSSLSVGVAAGTKRVPEHPDRAIPGGLEARGLEVDVPVGQVELVGIGPLVERVRGHRGHRADLVGVRRLDREGVVLDDAEQAIRAVPRVGGGPAAFEDLAHVQRQARVEAGPDGKGRDDRGVARAPGDDHLRAGVEGGQERLHAHLGHDARGPIHVGGGQRAVVVERAHPAARDLRPQPAAIHLGVDHRGAEAVAPLAAELAVEIERPLQVRAAATPARGADQHRDAPVARGVEDHGEVALGRAAVDERHARAQVVGAGIGRSGVEREDRRVAGEAALHGAGGDAVAEHAERREDGHRMHVRGSYGLPQTGSGHGIAWPASGTCCCAPYTSVSPTAPEGHGRRSVIFTAKAGSNSMMSTTSSGEMP